MKKYSVYFYAMMALAVLAGFTGYTLINYNAYGASAVMSTMAFIFWYAGVMAPDEEKYRGH